MVISLNLSMKLKKYVNFSQTLPNLIKYIPNKKIIYI